MLLDKSYRINNKNKFKKICLQSAHVPDYHLKCHSKKEDMLKACLKIYFWG